MKRNRKRIVLIAILLVLTLAVIWGSSTFSIPDSQAQSLGLLSLLQPLLDRIFGVGVITDHILRKTAHFCEFALLGAELRLLFLLLGQRGLQGQANALFAALAAAVTDEAIQILSARGSQVKDVLLDFCGAFVGALAVLLLALLHRRRKARKSG